MPADQRRTRVLGSEMTDSGMAGSVPWPRRRHDAGLVVFPEVPVLATSVQSGAIRPPEERVHGVARNWLAQPLGKVCQNEFVILQVGIQFTDAIYLFRLAGRQVFVRVKTPAPFK
jgi:hypothetical protein